MGSSHALVTALKAVLRRVENAVWIASAQSEEDVAVSKEPAPYEVEDLRIRLVEHDPEAYDLMYNELANPLLWSLKAYTATAHASLAALSG